MTNSHFLGLDAGGSGTQWVLMDQQRTVAEGTAPPLTTALIGTPEGQQTLQALLEELPVQPAAIHLGLPGLSARSRKAAEIAQRLAEVAGLKAGQVTVEGDLDLAYRAHLAPGAGILVYAGTGSIAYAVAQNGQVTRAGGRGYRIGDEGGGASIGRAALHWVTDWLDVGQRPQGPLAEQITRITGGLDWETLRQFVYGSAGAASLARIAPAVTLAAAAGDRAALEILQQAARALAHLAHCIRQQLGPVHLPVVATGGALRSPPLQAALQQALPGVTLQFKNHAAVAAELARASRGSGG